MRRFAPIVTFLAGCAFTVALLTRCSVAPANAGDVAPKTQVFTAACDQSAKYSEEEDITFAIVRPPGFSPRESVVTAMLCDCTSTSGGKDCFAKTEAWQPDNTTCVPASADRLRITSDSIYVMCGGVRHDSSGSGSPARVVVSV